MYVSCTYCREFNFNPILDSSEVLWHENFDLENIVSPVDYNKLEQMLRESGYNNDKTMYLVEGFKNGFSIGYSGSELVKRTAPNLKISRIRNWLVEQSNERSKT